MATIDSVTEKSMGGENQSGGTRKRRLTKQERKAAKRLKRARLEKMTGKKKVTSMQPPKTKTEKKKKKKKKKKQTDDSKDEAKPWKASQEVKDIILTLSTRDGTLSDRLNPSHAHYDAELKAKWKTFSKRERTEIVKADHNLIREKLEAVKAIVHPFETKVEDHCESPLEAFEDIAPILERLAKDLGKTPETLKIYDPYYCTCVYYLSAHTEIQLKNKQVRVP